MYRYVATRIALQKNPYPAGSQEWARYNEGFVSMMIPHMPSRWDLAMMALYAIPPIAGGALAGFAMFLMAR